MEPGHPSSTLPAARAHVDQSPGRAREALGSELGFESQQAFQDWVSHGGRAAIVNVWRPLKGPVRCAPLTVCDGRSVESSEVVLCHDFFGEHILLRYHGGWRALHVKSSN